MIALTCPSCQTRLKVKAEAAGRRVRCPRCRQELDVAPGREPDGNPPLSLPEQATLPPKLEPSDAMTPAPPDGDGAAEIHAPRADGAAVKAEGVYELSGEIARGGMGAILRAVDAQLGREVAIKVLLDATDTRQKARFLDEARITGQLEHPNIVPIHQLGVGPDGGWFFAMKMVKGRSLADVLREPRPEDSTARLLTVFVGVCNAVAYAHSRQVVHRDLKPANVMVGDFGEVYVMDWGLAKVLGREAAASDGADTPTSDRPVATAHPGESALTQAGSILGTPAYMSPEQAQGKAVDQRSDIYALGAILYEVLTGVPPVGHDSDHLVVLVRVMEGTIRTPEQQAPDRARQGLIPAELSAVALKALARNPADRYPTVETLRRDIQLFLEGRSVSAKQDSAWQLFRKLVRRNRGASIATAASLIVLAVVLTVAFVLNYQERLTAEAAQKTAENHYQAFLAEQADKRAQAKNSAPAFLRAARLLADEQNFDDALAEVNIALDADPGLTDAYLFRGQVLLVLERFAEAEAPLRTFTERQPEDVQAAKLADLAARPQPDKAMYFWLLVDVFDKQKARPFLVRMTRLAERFVGQGNDLLALYRKRIESVRGWAGLGKRLTRDRNGDLHLSFMNLGKQVPDLSPLRDMKLVTLNLYRTAFEDLTPLNGMPLTSLDLGGCAAVSVLRPLQGMELTRLNLQGLDKITDLEPLRRMPLRDLKLHDCTGVTDLDPLRDMPLTVLDCGAYRNMKIVNLEPLAGLKTLKKLDLGGSARIKDLRPLSDLPLEWLSLYHNSAVTDFEPLRRLPLAHLDLYTSAIRDLDVLKDMRLLTWLSLDACGNVENLTPLAGKPLTYLNLNGLKRLQSLNVLEHMPLAELHLNHCEKVQSFDVLRGLPLTRLVLSGCSHLTSLEFLRGSNRLEHLSILDCKQLHDLGPLKGLPLKTIALTPDSDIIDEKSMELLHEMNLDRVNVSLNVGFDARDFWKKYKAGEFKRR